MTYVSASDLHVTYPIYRRVDQRSPGEIADSRIIHRNGRLLGTQALRGLSLELQAGTRIAVIGRNGSGKTTLLQVLAGLLPPDRGRVETVGRLTSLININLGLRHEASGHRNITMMGLAGGRTRREIEERRAEIVAFSELNDFLDMPVSTYSSGMRMRLSFAIATAFEPDILILDEWLSTGDVAFRKKATKRMASFVETAGILILASHSTKLLRDNCNHAIWLDEGVARMRGPVDEVLAAYAEV